MTDNNNCLYINRLLLYHKKRTRNLSHYLPNQDIACFNQISKIKKSLTKLFFSPWLMSQNFCLSVWRFFFCTFLANVGKKEKLSFFPTKEGDKANETVIHKKMGVVQLRMAIIRRQYRIYSRISRSAYKPTLCAARTI